MHHLSLEHEPVCLAPGFLCIIPIRMFWLRPEPSVPSLAAPGMQSLPAGSWDCTLPAIAIFIAIAIPADGREQRVGRVVTPGAALPDVSW